MDIASMREWFDILQDKYNTAGYTNNEKDSFLNDASWNIINGIIGDDRSPSRLEKDKAAVYSLDTLIKSTTITTDGNGFLSNTAINTAVSGTMILPLKVSRETVATGSVTISGSSGSIDSITVNGVEIMSGAENYVTSLAATASNVADNINANSSSPNYTALASSNVVTIYAATGSGTTPNGFVVTSTATTLTTVDVNMSGGSSDAPSPARFVRHGSIDKYQDNTYKKGTDSAPLYTVISTGLQVYATTTANRQFSLAVLVEPTQATDLPTRLHYKIVANALAKVASATEAEMLAFMDAHTKG